MSNVGMRALKIVAAWLGLAVLTFAQHKEDPRRRTVAEDTGLQGPVHTHLLTTKKINADPRLNPQVPIPAPSKWMVFDRAGAMIEYASSFTPDGKPELLVRHKVDYRGRPVESVTSDSRGIVKSTTSTEGSCTTEGRELRFFTDGKLASRVREIHDERRRLAEKRTFSAEGKLTLEEFSQYNDRNQRTEYKAIGIQSFEHRRDRYDEQGNLLERIHLDAAGKPIISFAFNQDDLLSAWRDPECACYGWIGVTPRGKYDCITWTIDADGILEKKIEKNARPGKFQNQEIERYRGAKLVEKLTFQYEEDHYGNWTKRKVFAWDPQLNTMVEIQEDTRLIEYYQ